MKTLRIAVGFVLVASMVSSRAFQRAFVIVTRSAAGGVPGVPVMVVVRVTPNHAAVMVIVRFEVTDFVLTEKAALAAPPLTTRSAGTCTTAGSLVDSRTSAPSVAPLKVTVPVAAPPPTTLFGATDTDVSEGPAGVAWFTTSVAVRGTLPIAAVMETNVSGAAALVVMVNVAVVDPVGTTTVAGTAATVGSELKSSTVVGTTSAKAVVTVPCDEAPSRTWSGFTDNAEIELACPVPGRTRTVAEVSSAVTRRARRMPPITRLARGPDANARLRAAGFFDPENNQKPHTDQREDFTSGKRSRSHRSLRASERPEGDAHSTECASPQDPEHCHAFRLPADEWRTSRRARLFASQKIV